MLWRRKIARADWSSRLAKVELEVRAAGAAQNPQQKAAGSVICGPCWTARSRRQMVHFRCAMGIWGSCRLARPLRLKGEMGCPDSSGRRDQTAGQSELTSQSAHNLLTRLS